jgi:hypothetical protein
MYFNDFYTNSSGGNQMEKVNLKIFFSIFIIFIMFFAPLAIELYPDDNAYAMSKGSGSRKNKNKHFSVSSKNNEVKINEESGQIEKFGDYNFIEDGNSATVHTPEPATMLLLGSGVVGLVALKRKFKK